jgi:hypothetical protein
LIEWSVFLGFCSTDRPLSARLGVLVEVEWHVYGWGSDGCGGSHGVGPCPVGRDVAADKVLHVLGKDLDRSLLGDEE